MRRVRGKTISKIVLRPFRTDNAGCKRECAITYRPQIFFTDGSHMYFSVDETETGDYGVVPHFSEEP